MGDIDLEIRWPVRCYNGCYDSATQRVFDRQDDVLKFIQSKVPDAHCTYFPAEGYHMVHVWGWPISGAMPTRGSALADAVTQLRLDIQEQ